MLEASVVQSDRMAPPPRASTDLRHLRLGGSGLAVGLCAPAEVAGSIASMFPSAWHVVPVWDPSALRWYANHLSVLCIALQGHQAQDSGWRVSLALNTAAACRIPVVYYVADHSWVNDTIRKVPLLDRVVVPSSRDKRVLAEATIAAVVKPELERIARRIQRTDLHFALRRILCTAVLQRIHPPGAAARLTADGQLPFFRRIKDLDTLVRGTGRRSFLESHAKDAGVPLYEYFRRITVLHAFPRYRQGANAELALQLSFASRDALEKYIRRATRTTLKSLRATTYDTVVRWALASVPSLAIDMADDLSGSQTIRP